MIDGLNSEYTDSTNFSGTNIYASIISGADISVGAGTIGNAELANNAASGTVVSKEYPVLYTGSPVVGNLAMQMGVFTAVSDSGLAVSFGKAFSAAPKLFLSTASGAQAYDGGVSAGSFIGIVPAGSSTVVNYFAIGSGRI